MTGSLQLRDYPADMMRLTCTKCGSLREEISQCERRGQMHAACMVHYVDLKP